MQKQGIVTILGSNHDAATSLRRTLSADMSSKTWLSQNRFSSMKKIASSEELSHSLTKSSTTDSSSSSEEELQIWNTIQKKEQPEELDIWSSILSQKANDIEASKLTATTPYVHPLVRRSKSCLSEKSLQICTESLGSETGSDGFSSETGDSEEEEEEEEEKVKEIEQMRHEVEELHVPKLENYGTKKSMSLPRSFPPPLPSLHIRSHRDNGRLFLQAVELPSQNNFCAQRENGRLVLTFAPSEEVEEEEEEVMKIEGDGEAEEAEAPMLLSSGMRLALMMNKPIKLGDTTITMSPKWSNEVVNFKDVDVVQHSPLPPRPRVRSIAPTISASFNAYEYYWRTKPVAKASKFQQSLENNLKSCKDSRRPFLFWEPYCIAT